MPRPPYRELSGRGTEAAQAAEALAYARECSGSWVHETFGGLLQSTLECRACGHRSHCFDAFLDLSLPVPAAHSCSLQVPRVGGSRAWASRASGSASGGALEVGRCS